jgi:hypothetical protein
MLSNQPSATSEMMTQIKNQECENACLCQTKNHVVGRLISSLCFSAPHTEPHVSAVGSGRHDQYEINKEAYIARY